MSRVLIVGLGRVGQGLALALACRGLPLHIYDKDPKRLAICLPLLGESGCAWRPSETSGRLFDVILVAVDTPLAVAQVPLQERSANVKSLFDVADVCVPVMREGCLFAIVSTCPVGTAEQVAERLSNSRGDLGRPDLPSFAVVASPERALPDRFEEEFLTNVRCVGGVTSQCTERGLAFFRDEVGLSCIPMSSREAEFTKIVENTSRMVGIALANELYDRAMELGLDINKVISAANSHPRVTIMTPGIGIGGHCVAVDPYFILGKQGENPIISSAIASMEARPRTIAEEIGRLMRSSGRPRLLFLGLAYKANISDFRNSPALEIVRLFSSDVRYEVTCSDVGLAETDVKPPATVVEMQAGLARADYVVVLVNHSQYEALVGDPELFGFQMIATIAGAKVMVRLP